MSLHDGVADFSWSYRIEKIPRPLKLLNFSGYEALCKTINISVAKVHQIQEKSKAYARTAFYFNK